MKNSSHLLDPLFIGSFDSDQIVLGEKENSLDRVLLKKHINSLGNFLVYMGVKPQDRIAIALPRGLNGTVAIYSVLYVGAVYVPLDMNNPKNRLLYIIKDAGVRIIIGESVKADWCPNGIKWLNILDTLEVCKGDKKIEKRKSFCGENLAAILYTSGSTGQPKGVALSHRAMCAFSDWAGEELKITFHDTIASLAPFYFDLSVFDLFTSLRFKACIKFIPNELTMSPAKMSLWLSENDITIWYTVPSVLSFLASKGNLSNTLLPKLRIIIFAGEVFPTPNFLKLSRLLPHIKFYNFYGPTETNVCCFWPVNKQDVNPSSSLPIGLPACGNRLKIDPVNEELLVNGPTLMSGYWVNGRLKNVFDEEGWYRTGDRVSINERKEFIYRGRLDRMIKVCGHRIDPREIEEVIYTFPGVQECEVVGVTDSNDKTQLAACIVANPKGDSLQLKKFLNQNLPSYMNPEYIYWFNSFPRLSNGKLDHIKIKNLVMKEQ